MRLFTSLLLLIFLTSCSDPEPDESTDDPTDPFVGMIEGVSLVPPDGQPQSEVMPPIVSLNATWVAVIPYAYGFNDQPAIIYPRPDTRWMETIEGVTSTVQDARAHGRFVFLKPSVWVQGYGWPGDAAMDDEAEWEAWEQNYSAYILEMAQLAEDLEVELFSLGTEYDEAVTIRPEFWPKLADSVREIYNGKITYAANWDNFQYVYFWDKLDYIGIDAYFPLLDQKTPSVGDLVESWQQSKQTMRTSSQFFSRPIIFTEFGYRSINGAMWKQWLLPDPQNGRGVNMEAQMNGYQAIFDTFWHEDWFAGGFLWNWFAEHETAGGPTDSDYTPQNKPAEAMIRGWYAE